jgi:hypothetical protein
MIKIKLIKIWIKLIKILIIQKKTTDPKASDFGPSFKMNTQVWSSHLHVDGRGISLQ